MSDHDRVKRWLVTPLVLVLSLAAHSAVAGVVPEAKAVAVYVEGVSPDIVRATFVAAISEHVSVIDPSVFAEALAKEGANLPIGPSLMSGAQRKSAISTLRNATAASGANSLIVGRSIQTGPKLSVALLWIDPRSPNPSVDRTVELSGNGDADKATVIGALGAQLDVLADEGATTHQLQRQRHETSTAIVVATFAFELGGRRLEYSDPITRNLPNYHVFGVPLPSIGAEFYPLAPAALPILRDIGLTAHFGRAFGLASATIAGTAVNTNWTTAGGAVRARFRTGAVRSPVVGLSGGVDVLTFDFDAKADLVKVAPGARYVSARVGVDTRIPILGRLAVLLDTGYDAPISAGPVHDRFRGRAVGGVDFGAGLAVLLAAGFEARLGAHYTRYFYTFHPFPGDPYVAGGALDEFVRFGVGGAYAY